MTDLDQTPIFLEADLSQIESRIVYILTGDPELVKLAQSKPWEFDQHTFNAAIIYKIDERVLKLDLKLDKKDPRRIRASEQRYVAKRTVHGAQRDMRGKRLHEQLLLDDRHVPIPECDAMLEVYHSRFPAIRNVYFRDVRRMVMRDKMLVNSWGRRLDLRYDRLDDELFRQAYSFLPQAENADWLNQHGLIPLHMYLKSLYNRPPNVQVHDSLLASVLPRDAYDVAKFIKANLEQRMLLGGSILVPYAEFKLGSSWEAEYEFKQLPGEAEFTEIAFEVARKVQEREQARRDLQLP